MKRKFITLYLSFNPEQNMFYALRTAISEPNNENLKSKNIFYTNTHRINMYDLEIWEPSY